MINKHVVYPLGLVPTGGPLFQQVQPNELNIATTFGELPARIMRRWPVTQPAIVEITGCTAAGCYWVQFLFCESHLDGYRDAPPHRVGARLELLVCRTRVNSISYRGTQVITDPSYNCWPGPLVTATEPWADIQVLVRDCFWFGASATREQLVLYRADPPWL